MATTRSAGLSACGETRPQRSAGGITSTTTLSGTGLLAHDALGRLTSECGPQVIAAGGCARWSDDPSGNLRTQTNDDGTPITYTYGQSSDTLNELQTLTGPPGAPRVVFHYDASGDTTRLTNTIWTTTPTSTSAINTGVQYDAQARPLTVTLLSGGSPLTVTLGYNAAGQRASYTQAQTGTVRLRESFNYRNGELAQALITPTGRLPYTDTYVYNGNGAPYELLRQKAGVTSRYWYALDGQGNVVALTDSTGKVVDRYAYDAWGEPTSNNTLNEQVPQQLRYRGDPAGPGRPQPPGASPQERSDRYDEYLSWYWVSTRYYDPEIARWMQPDPSQAEGVRTYVYVGDDPLDFTDPSGLSGFCDVPVLGGAACGAASFVGGVAGGVASGVVDTVQGFGQLGQGAWNSSGVVFFNPQAFQNQWAANAALATYISQHKLQTGQALLLGIVKPCGEAIHSGNIGRAVGRCGFDVVMLVGLKGVTKLADVGRVAETVDEASVGERTVLHALLHSGSTVDRNGLTRAGRAYQKHMDRGELPKVPNRTLNTAGQELLANILTNLYRQRDGEKRVSAKSYLLTY